MRSAVGAADLEEQQQEVEALQSIFEESFTVLDESPIQLELAISLDLGGPRAVIARPALYRTQSNQSETSRVSAASVADAAGYAGAMGIADAAVLARAAGAAVESGNATDVRREAKDLGNSADERDDVPEAVKYAEELLEQRGLPAQADSGGVGGISVQHMPPLRLIVTFCEGYPSRRPPEFQLASQWLSAAQLGPLCSELELLAAAQPETPVVFAWADWLQNNALEHLGLDGTVPIAIAAAPAAIHDARAISELQEPVEEVVQELCAFDAERSWWEWQQTAHLCQICFSEKPGTNFVKIGGCGHTFCTECSSEMMRVHIAEGSVSSIRCPLPDCRGEVAPAVVRQLASDEEYQRWKRLEVQKIISNLRGLAYCPRCESNGKETPVLPATEEEDADVVPLMICDRCDYSFCAACRDPYHPGTRCVAQIQRLEKLGLQDKLHDKDKMRRKRLAEELESLKLILGTTVPCAKCKMPVSRTQGCNHMICTNCNTHFCYRCGADITEAGYGHFRADKCPTFDREEVERMQRGGAGGYGEEELEAELEELRRQYPDQANIVWNFVPPPGAWRRAARRRQAADAPCPRCGQWNPRAGFNNHIKCRACKANFCYACRKTIANPITAHFRGPGACAQHSD